MFKYLAQDPVRFKNFNGEMQAKTAQTILPYDMFPFKEELGKVETTDDTILLVDVCGGNEQVMEYDFFTPQPVKDEWQLSPIPHIILANISGVLTYYIRRCLHDWPEDQCITILKNIAAAMTSKTDL
jgi:hypothetical protein